MQNYAISIMTVGMEMQLYAGVGMATSLISPTRVAITPSKLNVAKGSHLIPP